MANDDLSDPSTILGTLRNRFVDPGPELVISQWLPVDEGLEARWARCEWQDEGLRPFYRTEVPYAVNNSAWMPHRAAALVFDSCLEAPPTTPLTLIEYGAGVGLFARQFVEHFLSLCAEADRPFGRALRYVATDVSPRTLQQWQHQGIFEPFLEHICVGIADVSRPGEIRALDGTPIVLSEPRAVFMNYVLDALPASVLRRGPQAETEELQVETVSLVPAAVLEQQTGCSVAQLKVWAADTSADAARSLRPFGELFEHRLSFRPARGALSSAIPAPQEGPQIHSHGASAAIDAVLPLLGPAGFLLVNDMNATPSQGLQRLGSIVAYPLNFRSLARHCESHGATVLAQTPNPARKMLTALFAKEATANLRATFGRLFDAPELLHAQGAAVQAEDLRAQGRPDLALEIYQGLLERNAQDWHTLAYAADLVQQHLGAADAALQLAERAIALNPWTSPSLYNILGNAHFALGQFPQAHAAFERALELDGINAQTWLNLAYSHAATGAVEEALRSVAHGLAYDQAGHFRKPLLEQQQVICAALDAQEQARQRRKKPLAEPLARLCLSDLPGGP